MIVQVNVVLTLKMTPAQVFEMSVTVNNNSPVQNYVHPDHQTQHTFEITPGFKPFTVKQSHSESFVGPHVTTLVIFRISSFRGDYFHGVGGGGGYFEG